MIFYIGNRYLTKRPSPFYSIEKKKINILGEIAENLPTFLEERKYRQKVQGHPVALVYSISPTLERTLTKVGCCGATGGSDFLDVLKAIPSEVIFSSIGA